MLRTITVPGHRTALGRIPARLCAARVAPLASSEWRELGGQYVATIADQPDLSAAGPYAIGDTIEEACDTLVGQLADHPNS